MNKLKPFAILSSFALIFNILIPITLVAHAEGSITISSCADLQNINHDGGVALGGSYIQTASFSCSGIENFVPLGTSGTPFLGTYDGGNFTISDLTINRPDTSYIGLFGMTNSSASISNVVLKDFNITGKNGVGGLIGANNSSGLVVANSHVSGNVTGRYYVGGLVGMNRGEISNSSSSATVTGGGAYQDYPVIGMVGGLVGRNGGSGTITDSYSSGNVIGNNSYKNAGGLVGANLDWSGTIENSYALGDVSATDYVGGLVGYISGSGNITDSRAEGTVAGVDYVGGLLGSSISTITRSYATGNVAGQSNVGGLAGYSNGSITDSHATGIVTGTANYVGGLAGYSSGVITGSHATGSVNSSSDTVGGLVGASQNDISRSYATGNVTGNNTVGGLTGYLNAPLRTSYASGNVIGNDRVGGLIGESNDSTYDSYATGNVTGIDDVGGLIGLQNNGYNVQNTYNKGQVEGTSNVGGLIGYNDGGAFGSIITSSYYDVITTGIADNGLGTPKTTAEMKTQNTFVDWDFLTPDGIWSIDTLGKKNSGYPYFQWQVFDETGPTFEVLGNGDSRTINIDAGQVITTNPYIIKVKPSDPAGVTKVEFYIDDILIGTDTTADADGYYTCSWDTSKYHSEVKVIAFDTLGNTTTLNRSTTVRLASTSTSTLPETGGNNNQGNIVWPIGLLGAAFVSDQQILKKINI